MFQVKTNVKFYPNDLTNTLQSGIEGRTFKMTHFDSAQRAAIFYYQLAI